MSRDVSEAIAILLEMSDNKVDEAIAALKEVKSLGGVMDEFAEKAL